MGDPVGVVAGAGGRVGRLAAQHLHVIEGVGRLVAVREVGLRVGAGTWGRGARGEGRSEVDGGEQGGGGGWWSMMIWF